MMRKRLLVSDIDGTLLCCGEPTTGLDHLKKILSVHGNEVRLLYATGRSFTNTWPLIAVGLLPRPDGIACLVGTEVWLPPWSEPDPGYSGLIAPCWDRAAVLDAAKRFSALDLQPAEFQNPYKASFFLDDRSTLLGLTGELKKRKIRAGVIYSCARYLDLLPEKAGKGFAVEYLRRLWEIPCSNVLACGDSGNDLDMLLDQRFSGVAVGNADAQLDCLAGAENLYRSDFTFAEGLLDGAEKCGFW